MISITQRQGAVFNSIDVLENGSVIGEFKYEPKSNINGVRNIKAYQLSKTDKNTNFYFSNLYGFLLDNDYFDVIISSLKRTTDGEKMWRNIRRYNTGRVIYEIYFFHKNTEAMDYAEEDTPYDRNNYFIIAKNDAAAQVVLKQIVRTEHFRARRI